MAETKVMDIRGLDELLKAIETMPDTAIPILTQAMEASTLLVAGVLRQYPPATESNQPGRIGRDGRPMGYYERGAGWWYPVVTERTMTGRTGKRLGKMRTKTAGVVGYKLIRSSQKLGKRWAVKVIAGEASVTGMIGTNVSYAEYVEGDKQAAIHAAHHWPTTTTALTETEPDIYALFDEALEKLKRAMLGPTG
jgi:hypothetical protein